MSAYNEAVEKSMQLSMGTLNRTPYSYDPRPLTESEPFPEPDLPSPWTLGRPKVDIHEMVQGPLHSR